MVCTSDGSTLQGSLQVVCWPRYLAYLVQSATLNLHVVLQAGMKMAKCLAYSVKPARLVQDLGSVHFCILCKNLHNLAALSYLKQYWFLRQSQLKCMIREWGSPTLFLTFSSAEYESPDITEFLRRVDDVSSGYNIGKLCTEDPISVSRQFS